jgi:hypothetical protein
MHPTDSTQREKFLSLPRIETWFSVAYPEKSAFNSQHRQQTFPSSKAFILWIWGPLSLQINEYTQFLSGAMSSGMKQAGRVADHSLESSVEVKDIWIFTSIHSVMWSRNSA